MSCCESDCPPLGLCQECRAEWEADAEPAPLPWRSDAAGEARMDFEALGGDEPDVLHLITGEP